MIEIDLLPEKAMGFLYTFDAAESKYGNEIAPLATTFDSGAFEF
jgi:hypothetical protein